MPLIVVPQSKIICFLRKNTSQMLYPKGIFIQAVSRCLKRS
ncbi:hypothetical protein NBRC111894_4081 [Sporolactobacillus inulinus]|uniref:Uncharacterized protein n=1 Tax=Sporolactobacillus inulinus TaxID=2078 RepID=A0A4Y1ZH97_9BACL|nr:hypothetical protein NBRC111894_4081 [Sporolactobacillus inulinus]